MFLIPPSDLLETFFAGYTVKYIELTGQQWCHVLIVA